MLSKRLLGILVFLLAISLNACSSSYQTVRLNKLDSYDYQTLHDQLTSWYDYDAGFFREVNVKATLLPPAMGKYRDLPENGTGIEFFIDGREECFVISRMFLTIETGDGGKVVVRGLGTKEQKTTGELDGVSNPEIGFKSIQQMQKTDSDLPIYKDFMIVLPIKISSETKYIKIVGEDSAIPDYKFNLAWHIK